MVALFYETRCLFGRGVLRDAKDGAAGYRIGR